MVPYGVTRFVGWIGPITTGLWLSKGSSLPKEPMGFWSSVCDRRPRQGGHYTTTCFCTDMAIRAPRLAQISDGKELREPQHPKVIRVGRGRYFCQQCGLTVLK